MSNDRGDRQAAAGEAWDALYQFVLEGEGQRRFHEACETTGLAPGVVKTLLQLRPGDPVSMGELAGIFRCDPSYVTSLVDGLEHAGLAERQLHPTDRRVKVVAITDAGVRTQSQVRKVLAQPPEAFAALGTDELRQLRDLLLRLVSRGAR
ncbi:MAG TPA: MarR family transcriptional regulator [Acidimicrobiales bacterium]|nr:MarR family transcriptional regulator [Acidimicrobiales bacterium]